MPESPALEVNDLYAGYGGGDILQGVSIRIDSGEAVAVVGRNGVGKTTLVHCIIGLVRARQGSIHFEDRDITRSPSNRRAALGIGYVPQGRDIFPELTVEDNLKMGEGVARGKKSRYDLVYEYFPILRERRRQLGGTFSGGQQQMLAIGRALVGAPDLILLDEPSVGIQPSIVQEIGQKLRKLNQQEGLTMLVVEQNLGLIGDVATRGYAMNKGLIVDTLSSSDLRSREVLIEHLAV